MLYTINNNTCKKHKVKVYKFNVSTKQIYLQMSVNTSKPKQKVDERKMYMLRVYMLSDASFIQIGNVKQEAQIYKQIDFNMCQKLKMHI